MEQDFFSNLPSEIIINILKELPSKTISRCCCVCKGWQKLVSAPEFANLRKFRQPNSLMIFKDWSSVNVVELENEPTGHDFYCLPGSTMEVPEAFGQQNSTFMFASINGLLCFHDTEDQCLDKFHLWNPATHESITIPGPGGVCGYPNVINVGFGLSSINGHYKLVRIYQEPDVLDLDGGSNPLNGSECHVYTLGQGCWRNLGHSPFKFAGNPRGVFLNGNLHWWNPNNGGTGSISCFDIENETFKPFSAPPEIDEDYYPASLGVYKDNCLSVWDESSVFEARLWLMKDYGIKDSWVKEMVIDKQPIRRPLMSTDDDYFCHQELIQILKVFEDGEILLLCYDDLPFLYNPETQSLQVVDLHKFVYGTESISSMQVVDYMPNFRSLKRFRMEAVEETFHSNVFQSL